MNANNCKRSQRFALLYHCSSCSCANLVLLALVVRIITEVTRWARAQRTPADATPGDAPDAD